MGLITSTRMYDVAPAARAAWHDLLSLAFAQAQVTVAVVPHAWPTPLAELWSRPGLMAAFMCGWPYARAQAAGLGPVALASVVPDFPDYEAQARYRSEFLVRVDSPCQQLADAFGSRYGWMVEDSQSGWNAPRGVLADYAHTRGKPLFSESKGPFGNPRALLQALAGGEIDLTAVDGWYLDLLRAHDPAALAGLRTLAYTPWTANPLLVVGADVDPDARVRVRAALLTLHERAEASVFLRAAHVSRFVPVADEPYRALRDGEAQASSKGYGFIV